MVQIEAPSTPECQEGVPSQGGQHREEHSTAVQSTMFKQNIIKDSFKWSEWDYMAQIEASSNTECHNGVQSQGQGGH